MSELEHIQSQLHEIADDATTAFGKLSPAQLNWKPGPDRWSVAQCLEHLITTNKSYEPVIAKVVNGEYRESGWARLPVLPTLWAKLFMKSLDPANTRKLKAPKTLAPTLSDITKTIVADFATHQEEVAQQIKATAARDPEHIVIVSPAAKFITYTLMDAYRIMVVHEQRHLAQAKRVVAEPSFPQ